MAKRKTKLIKKPKKKWFIATAPDIYKNTEIGEIAAFEPKNLVGRPIEINLFHLTGIPKDRKKLMRLKITDTRGEKALTMPWKLFLKESYVQRACRRFKERIITIITSKTKDDKKIKVKLLTLSIKKLPRIVKTEVTKKAEQILSDEISKIKSTDFFVSQNLAKASSALKKELKMIYPINKIIFWKITLI